MKLLGLLAVVSSLRVISGKDGFLGLWESSWRNITVPRELAVNGTFPGWLQGGLFRNAGGAFETKDRNVSYAFDGIPKIFKFAIADGTVKYQERFLTTMYYEYIQNHSDIPKVPLMGATVPPFEKFAPPSADAGDVDNIQVWQLNGDKQALALTDSALVGAFDLDTLEGLGHLPANDSVKEGLIQLSCAHPQYDPTSNGKVLINFASTFFGGGSVIGRHEIQVYRMGIDKVRRAFGSVVVPYAPYIHSFGVTNTKMILVVYPLGFDITCVLEFSPMIECMQCPRSRPATIYVFDLASTEKTAPPIATIKAPYHMVMHHVNAYDDVEATQVIFEVSAQDSCDTLFSGPTGAHAKLDAMRDESARDLVQHWGKLRTYKIDLSTPSKPHLSSADTVLLDANGYVYDIDFPYVNPNYASKKHRYVWGATAYAQNSTHYADWAVVKVDRDKSGVNTVAWYKKGHYPSEPVFVPKPQGVEDEGVLLVQVLDGDQNRGYLLALDAADMTEIATASLGVGEHLPYSQHGRWIDQAYRQESSMPVVV